MGLQVRVIKWFIKKIVLFFSLDSWCKVLEADFSDWTNRNA
jgi:hypothetical protein